MTLSRSPMLARHITVNMEQQNIDNTKSFVSIGLSTQLNFVQCSKTKANEISFRSYASALGVVTAAGEFHALAEELGAFYNYLYDTHLHCVILSIMKPSEVPFS